MEELRMALELEPDLRNRLADEPDFLMLRGNPEFDQLLIGSAPRK